MAELRKVEQALRELCQVYDRIRADDRSEGKLPPLSHSLVQKADDNNSNDIPPAATTPSITSYTHLRQLLKDTQDQLQELEANNVPRLRKRLSEKDPVTGNPRYGLNTQKRVQAILACHEELWGLLVASKSDGDNDTDNDNNQQPPQQQDTTGTTSDNNHQLFQTIASQAQQEADQEEQARNLAQQQEQERLARAKQEQLEREQAERQAQEQAQRAAQEQARLEQQRRQDARDAERQAREAERQADREWLASVANKGTPDGVRAQLAVLMESTQHDTMAQMMALTALHTLFQQICAHPEEVNFRRIRRNHERFQQEIGQYRGGQEVLLAAGFRPAELDEVKCLYCKEPNLETDMDGWSEWFDLLKATLQLIEEEMKSR